MNIQLATSEDELHAILALQKRNHVSSVSDMEKTSQGFVTVQHDFQLLKSMHQKAAQIIALDKGNLIGYALVMLKDFKEKIPVLEPMFDVFEDLIYKHQPLRTMKYYVMGQICIAASHRGKGVFEALYQKHKEVYSHMYDLCITEVSTRNIRSLKAHEKVGFENIHTYKDDSDEWAILAWDWKK